MLPIWLKALDKQISPKVIAINIITLKIRFCLKKWIDATKEKSAKQ